MLTFEQARALAQTWVQVITNGACTLTEESLRRPYGWVFFYDSANGELIAGNAPTDHFVATLVIALAGVVTDLGSGVV